MLLHVSHHTDYHYSEPQRRISQSHRLYPSECDTQQIESWEVTVENAEFGEYFYDGAGDRIRTMSITNPVESIRIQVTGEVNTTDKHGLVKSKRDVISPLTYLRDTDITAPNAALVDLAHSDVADQPGKSLDLAHSLSHVVREAIRYTPGVTDHGYTAAQALAKGQGVCQDHAHCLIALARINGVPARYVVGYLSTDADDQAHDASHAWAELYIEDLGWVGFDATNECCPDERYIRIGSGLDALAAAPVRGIAHGSGSETMQTMVTIAGNQQ